MNEPENSYIASAKATLAKAIDPIAMVDELVAIEKPVREEITLNTNALINSIDTLAWEREDGELDNSNLQVEELDAAELRIAENILQDVKQCLADIDTSNWYRKTYAITFAYSQVKDGSYSYRITRKPITAKSHEEAEKELHVLRSKAPKIYAKEPGFTLEDVRISSELVDSNGKSVKIHYSE